MHASLYGQSEQNTKVQKRTKVLITQPFFELQTPDFAWKFIWTVKSNGKVLKVQKYKSTKQKSKKYKKISGARY